MITTKKKGLCFLVSNESRDYYLLVATIYYLERFENFEISFEFIWNAHKIKNQKPELVILPNERGSNLFFQVSKYCKQNNILLLSHDSEGNFNSNIDYDFWGYNKSKDIVCPIIYTWNQRIKDFLLTKYNLDENRFYLSGAPGFDKYKYLPKIDKFKLLKKYNLEKFDKVVGYAGWAFGKLYNKELSDVTVNLNMTFEAGRKWLEYQRDQVETCLETVIKRYPDILFILKKHPRENFESDYRDSRNEMNRLNYYPNVLYLKDEEDIQDLIQISDLWMAFESTSIMEAWLMNVPTLMINPDPNFTRVDFHLGSAAVKNANEIESIFNQYFNDNNADFFFKSEILAKRNDIIKNSIGFDDGFNHLRIIKSFKPYLKTAKKPDKIKINWRFFRLYLLLHLGKNFYKKSIYEKLPKFKKTIWVFENQKLEKIRSSKEKNFKDLDDFYTKNQITTISEIERFIEKL
jgi:surface carbohydrate biosynthesis protein